jgi:hypothetical protein
MRGDQLPVALPDRSAPVLHDRARAYPRDTLSAGSGMSIAQFMEGAGRTYVLMAGGLAWVFVGIVGLGTAWRRRSADQCAAAECRPRFDGGVV